MVVLLCPAQHVTGRIGDDEMSGIMCESLEVQIHGEFGIICPQFACYCLIAMLWFSPEPWRSLYTALVQRTSTQQISAVLQRGSRIILKCWSYCAQRTGAGECATL